MRSETPDPVTTVSRDVLDFINLVSKTTQKASWVSSVPSEFGESRTGTLKADEWRTYATIYLPIALTLRWGRKSIHQTCHEKESLSTVLDHTMSLVQALCIACYRTTDSVRTQAMHSHLHKYLRDLPSVHSGATATTNHHMSLHLSKFMDLYGPVHSWWTYPFERLIGQLQHMPTNHKFGEFS